MITVWPQDTFGAAEGSTSGLCQHTVRIYNWVKGEFERTGKPVRAADVAFLFGIMNKVTDVRSMPARELSDLIDASLIYVVDHDPAAVIEREQAKRAAEIKKMMGGAL